MAEAAAAAKGIDKWYEKLADWVTKKISGFVAFLFFLFAAGMIYGHFIVPRFEDLKIFLLLAPFVLALIAYYSRTFATILFIALIVLVFL